MQHCKADIAFLLNPASKAVQRRRTVTSSAYGMAVARPTAAMQPMALFRSLSPVVHSPERAGFPSLTASQRFLGASITPREKRRSNLRCYGDKMAELPTLSLAALCISGADIHVASSTESGSSNSSSNSNSSSMSSCSSEDGDDARSTTSSVASTASTTQAGKTRVRKMHTPPCRVAGCKNLAVSRGCCVRHGGGSRCITPGCTKRAKLYQHCFQHGGYKTCTEPGCTRKAKRYGHCWSHGGGRICDVPECTKVSTQGGLCWAHGGGNRCKLEGCSRRSYLKYGYYCVHHAKLNPNAEADANTDASANAEASA